MSKHEQGPSKKRRRPMTALERVDTRFKDNPNFTRMSPEEVGDGWTVVTVGKLIRPRDPKDEKQDKRQRGTARA